ncbi:tumor necrosis factor receptor superfamily member 14-like isoform X1 [Eucyclogobius newberryi]|uniref:tumor necrosis factor receptor superfamily member 14-like isoform X1 n=1 Tax=Eucyclogobius newberryi TaxID=166745 RepID=UPI003B5B6126
MKRVIVFLILIKFGMSLTCHRAEYQIGQECCPMCPLGTRVNKHCTEFPSISCLPCDSGTYMNEPTGRTECFRCRICASGSGLREKVSCSSTSNTLCEPEEGHFCKGPLEEGSCKASQRHRSCEQGQYIQQPGNAAADTQCSPCSEGTFSNGTVFVCQPHTLCEQNDKITIKEGTSDLDTECAEGNSNILVIVLVLVLAIVGAVIGAGVFIYKKYKKKKGVV